MYKFTSTTSRLLRHKTLVVSLGVIFVYSATLAFASGGPFSAHQTLDPDCLPSAVNCYVTGGNGGGGIAIGDTVTGGTASRVLYTDNSGNVFSDQDFTRDSVTHNTLIAKQVGTQKYGFSLDDNLLGSGSLGSVLIGVDTAGNGSYGVAGVTDQTNIGQPAQTALLFHSSNLANVAGNQAFIAATGDNSGNSMISLSTSNDNSLKQAKIILPGNGNIKNSISDGEFKITDANDNEFFHIDGFASVHPYVNMGDITGNGNHTLFTLDDKGQTISGTISRPNRSGGFYAGGFGGSLFPGVTDAAGISWSNSTTGATSYIGTGDFSPVGTPSNHGSIVGDINFSTGELAQTIQSYGNQSGLLIKDSVLNPSASSYEGVISASPTDVKMVYGFGVGTPNSYGIQITNSGVNFSKDNNISYTFPGTDGSSGQALVTNGSGKISWGNPSISNVFPGDILLGDSYPFGQNGSNLIRLDNSYGNVIVGTLVPRLPVNNSNFVGDTFVGDAVGNAIDFNLTSSRNTWMGQYAGREAHQANVTTLYGSQAGGGWFTLNGYNLAIGVDSFYQQTPGLTSGSSNTIIGGYEAGLNVTGSNNVFIGTQTAMGATGSNSIAIGTLASTDVYSNSIALGFGATNDSPNEFMIGSAGSPIDKIVMVGSGGTSCSVDVNGTACVSDQRLKTDITDLPTDTLDTLMKVRTVTYHWIDPHVDTDTHIGFLAQDIQQSFPSLVASGQGGYLHVNYAAMAPVLTEAIRELALKIKPFDDLTSAQNTIAQKLVTWLGSATNGIGDFFANRGLFKQEICVDGECLTKDDIHALLQQVHTQQPTVAPPTNTVTPPTDIVASSPTPVDAGIPSTNTGTTTGDTTPPASPSTDTTSSGTGTSTPPTPPADSGGGVTTTSQ